MTHFCGWMVSYMAAFVLLPGTFFFSFSSPEPKQTQQMLHFKARQYPGRKTFDATFYPESSMLRVETRLFTVTQTPCVEGRANWAEFMKDPEKRGEVHLAHSDHCSSYLYIRSIPRDTADMWMTVYWMENLESRYRGVDLLTYVKKIQRTFLFRARARRHMAVFMAFHVRLGKDSPMACLPEDLLVSRILRLI